MKKGKIYIIEGLDGCGKTTVINNLKEKFPKAVFTREPGGSVFGEKIRNVLLDDESKNESPLTNFLAFWSARSSHFDKVILPNINKGKNVFSDRADPSTYAFQIVAGKNKDLEKLFFELRKKIFKIEPIYIYLKIPVSVSKERMNGRVGKTHFDRKNDEYHKMVKAGYDKFFGLKEIKKNVRVIDATKGIKEVFNDVMKVLKQ
jgi:dTMP kinase